MWTLFGYAPSFLFSKFFEIVQKFYSNPKLFLFILET